MRTIVKIIYIAFALVLSVIIALGMYTSYASTNYSNLLSNAISKADTTENYADADYADIVRCFSIFSTPIKSKPDLLYADENGKDITFIYESVNQHTATYTENDKETTIDHIENVYLVVILHPKFYYNTLSDKTNPSCFRFYGENENQTFDYYFNLSADCNSSIFKEKPASEKEAVLYGGRTLLDTYKEYDLIFFPLTETTIGYVKEELGSNITGFNIVDNNSSIVYKKNDTLPTKAIPFNFDYPKTEGSFYSDMADFVRYYNIYTDNKNGKADIEADTVTAATQYIEKFTSDPSTSVSDFYDKYIQGYPHEAVYTGADMTLKTVGITALFVVAATLVFILLFHFRAIKNFVAKFSKKTEPEREVPNRRPQSSVVISKTKVKREFDNEQLKKDEPKLTPIDANNEETKEETSTDLEETKEETTNKDEAKEVEINTNSEVSDEEKNATEEETKEEAKTDLEESTEE